MVVPLVAGLGAIDGLADSSKIVGELYD